MQSRLNFYPARKAEDYRLTPAGRKRLREETRRWNRIVDIMTRL